MVAGVVLAGSMFVGGAAWAQEPQTPAPTPLHPIVTKPEGTGQNCTYSGSRGSNGATSSSTCPQPAAQLPAAQRFPYPGDPAPATNPALTSPAPAGTPNAPNAAQKFPFPGDDSKADVPKSPLQDAGSSGSSSRPDDEGSSSSSSSSGGVGADAVPDAPAGDTSDNLPAPKRARKKLTPPREPSNDEREEEDVKVAEFYQNDGNFAAAYLRAKDAIALDDTDPVAHFLLAESARRLGKLDEAKKQYQRCLELDPLPKERKGSQKALKEMTGG